MLESLNFLFGWFSNFVTSLLTSTVLGIFVLFLVLTLVVDTFIKFFKEVRI